MSRRRLSFTERRRARLALNVSRLDRLETRNTMTEPISVTALATGIFKDLALLGIMRSNGGSNALSGLSRADQASGQAQQQAKKAPAAPVNAGSFPLGTKPKQSAGGGGGGGSAQDASSHGSGATRTVPDSGLALTASTGSDAAQFHGISAPWKPASNMGGGGALAPRGGSGGPTPPRSAGRATQATASLPASTPGASGNGGSAALLAAVAGAGVMPLVNASSSFSAPVRQPVHAVPTGNQPGGLASGPPVTTDASSGGSISTTPPPLGSTPNLTMTNASGPSQNTFPYFPLYVLDVNDGVVLFPGVDEQATLRGSVILQAQVSGATVSTYNWNTSGITADATSIAGATTFQLTFQWTNSVSTPHIDPVTLSVTDSNSHVETYTYDFELPAGLVPSSGGGGNATWPQSLAPDTISAADPAWGSDNVSVDSNSGALDTSIPLPSYNPNVPALDLTYDSITANPLPIIVAENTLSSSGAVPSQVSATLTFNGTVGTTYYYNTSTLNPGDVQQIALQATSASSLATGRYGYSVQIVDHGSALTTITLSGTATLLNQSSSAFGDGWTLDGLEQITPATGGVILNEGGGGATLWFAGSPGSGGGT